VSLPDKTVKDFGAVQRNFDFLDKLIFVGSGAPNGVITASPPAFYLNKAGGPTATFWIKESGDNTNTGWVPK
jgi:hypothetical protein